MRRRHVSLQKKLLQAASLAAEEACARERGRCLWVLDQIHKELGEKLGKVILIEAQRHAIETKIKIARALFTTARMRIISGVAPPPPPKNDVPYDIDDQNSAQI